MDPSRRVTVELAPTPRALAAATRAVRGLLVDVGAYSLQHAACLAVTEIVTTLRRRSAGDCRLSAVFLPDRGRLRVEVGECEREIDPRWFPFVAALSTEWGVGAKDGRTSIWFEMARVDVDVPV